MAKEQKQEPVAAPEPDVQETPGPPKSYRLQITLALVGLVLFQVIVLYLLIPRKPTENTPEIQIPVVTVDTERTVERPINEGAFSVKRVVNDNNETFSLVMHVTVRYKEGSKFDRLYEARENAIIDRVTTVLSVSTRDERLEPGHAALKEQVRRAINDVLGVAYVRQVLFAEVKYESN